MNFLGRRSLRGVGKFPAFATNFIETLTNITKSSMQMGISIFCIKYTLLVLSLSDSWSNFSVAKAPPEWDMPPRPGLWEWPEVGDVTWRGHGLNME